MRRVRIVQASDWDLVGELIDDVTASSAAPRRVALRVLAGASGSEPRWQ
jgi:hypothetical protein